MVTPVEVVALILTVPVPYLEPLTPTGVDGNAFTVMVITFDSIVPSDVVVVFAVLLK